MVDTSAAIAAQEEAAKLELRLLQIEAQEKARVDFLAFAKYMWPEAILGEHHKIMADAFNRVADGTLKRLIINMGPRHSKSEFSSYLLPAFIMGRKPKTKIIQATHTGELAVRFGRKVRNMMDGEEYKQVFPNVALRADSKAAGRWDTDHGGEYFACLRLYAKVHTTRGLVPAGEIKVGDRLLNCGKPVTVKEIYHTTHDATVNIAGLDCSLDHPIWTMNRGWVYARDIIDSDILCTESIWDIMKALLRRAYGYLEYTHVSPLVQHQVSMHQSKKRKVERLRGTRNYLVRAMASVRQLLVGYGTPAFSSAHSGENRQRWSLFSRELPMGDPNRTGKQHALKCDNQWDHDGRTCQDAGIDSGSHCLSPTERAGSTGSIQVQEEELRTYSNPESIGWLRRAAAFLLSRGFPAIPKTSGRTKEYLAGIGKATQNLYGLLLGVRRVGKITRTEHQDIPFVNFLTDGDHTFFADGVLTHNCGVGGAMTGRGADLLIIDDPHSEQDALSELAMDNAWEWYTSGPRQRLQPGGAVVVVMTRWSTRDLTARLIKAQSSHKADRWEIIEFPAILPSGKPLWPEFWKLEELLAVKASLSPQKWQAQWQQEPTNDEGAILKRDWWKVWPSEEPPPVEYIIQSYDTAYSKKETADFSVITTWGVFYPDMDSGPNIILLDVTKGRWDFPELKRIAKEQYDQWQPDNVLIEAKATGITLQQELRRMGIPVTMYSPGGRRAGQDKVSRAHSVAPLLEAGMVWAPDTDWAEDLVEECAAFPNGDHDDMVDSCFVAGTKVLMGDGTTKSIETITIGEKVMTPDGPRKVTRTYDNGLKEIWELVTSHSTLHVTSNHLIKTERGWIPVDKLRVMCDTTVQYPQQGIFSWLLKVMIKLKKKVFTLTEENTTGIQIALIRPTEGILQGQEHGCIGMYGNTITVPSPKDVLFITLMETLRTIELKILHVCPNKPIIKNIMKRRLVEEKAKSNDCILNISEKKLLRGTNRKREENGIKNTLLSPWKQLGNTLKSTGILKKKSHVFGAVKNLWDILFSVSFVHRDAKLQNLDLGEVKHVRNTHTMHRVYDIEVEGEHCYFANGVLVHNCTQALMRFRAGNFISLASDDFDDGEKQEVAFEYY